MTGGRSASGLIRVSRGTHFLISSFPHFLIVATLLAAAPLPAAPKARRPAKQRGAGAAPALGLRAQPAAPDMQPPALPDLPAVRPGVEIAPAGIPGGSLQAPVVLSLDDAVQTALRLNPSLDEATAAIQRARAFVAEARAFQLPNLLFSGNTVAQGPIPTFTIDQPGQPGQPPQQRQITLGNTFTRNLTITGNYNVDPFGRLSAARRAEERRVNVQRGNFFTTQNELVYQVQNSYLSTLRAQALVTVAQKAVASANEQLRFAEARLRAGTAPEYDVIRARVQVANFQQQLTVSEANQSRALTGLARLLGIEATTPLQLEPITLPAEPQRAAIAAAHEALEPTGDPPATEPIPENLEAALSEAYDQRPEIYAAQWAKRAAQADVQFERRGRLPGLAAQGNYFFNPDAAGFAPITKSWSLLALATGPIWDAGLARARTRRAQADVRTFGARIESARNLVGEEVKQSLIDLQEAAVRRTTTRANTSQAEEALRIAERRYTAGLAASVEVTDAELALIQARINEVNADYDFISALANLNRSLGRYASEVLRELRAALSDSDRGGQENPAPPAEGDSK